MSTYAIGDVQGCWVELQRLLESFGFQPGRDRLWLVGDLVNRGPQSLEVLRFVRGLGDAAVTVLGNHDLHLLALARGHVKARDDDTLQAVLQAEDRDELLHWLLQQPLLHREGDTLMVHAGLLPQWDADQAEALAAEVQAALRGPEPGRFLSQLYGSQPRAWCDALQGADRLRVIVNAMTRMRFCTADGEMDFSAKGEAATAPAGCLPWFALPGRRSAGNTLVVGHWSALGVRLSPRLLALDSGCVWGGRLSALRLEDRTLFQVASTRPLVNW